jgi:ubiquinone/menaquinone biosynthesis C-methylase UbiE
MSLREDLYTSLHLLLQSFTRPLRKHKEVIREFILLNSLNKSIKILDFGCGEGLFSRIFENYGSVSYFGVDNDSNRIKKAKKSFYSNKFIIANETICFKNNIFDFLILNNVLHHMTREEIGKLILEIKRVMKKKSFILIIEIVPRSMQKSLFLKLITLLEERVNKIEYRATAFLDKCFTQISNNAYYEKLDDSYFLSIYQV